MQLEPLSNRISVFVSDTHRFNTDTILLAHFASPKRGERCADLGTGCGAIPLIWLAQYQPQSICGVELQADACELAQRSAEHCGVTRQLQIRNLDLRKIPAMRPRDPALCKLDLVTCNPPYKAQGAGVQNAEAGKRLARHEESCTMQQIAQAAAAMLKYGGRFCICQRPERLADCITALTQNKLEPKRLRFVQARAGKPPKLFLLQARRNGQPGGLVVDPPLLIYKEDNSFSDEMLQIYGEYREGDL